MALYKKKWLWVLLAVAAVAGYALFGGVGKAVEVGLGRAERRVLELTVTATATGTVKSDTEVKVAAQRPGRVSAIHVVEGDSVRKGGLIAELDSAEAGFSLQKAEAALEGLKASRRAFDAEVAAAIARASSRLDDSRQRYERLSALFERGFVSRDELDAARTEFEVARAEHESALSGKAQLSARDREIEAQAAAVKLARLDYDYSFLRAPIDGIVTSVPVKLGETIGKGSLVAEIIATESLYVEAFVDEADVGRVKTGQEVDITMDAFPGSTLGGRVYMISPVVLGEKQETRTFEVRTRVLDEGVELKPGMSADIEVIVGRKENALSVPSQAVIEREGKSFVFARDGSKARLREVKTGLSNWTLTEITGGLKEGDEVVITPDVKGLKDGVKVKGKKD